MWKIFCLNNYRLRSLFSCFAFGSHGEGNLSGVFDHQNSRLERTKGQLFVFQPLVSWLVTGRGMSLLTSAQSIHEKALQELPNVVICPGRNAVVRETQEPTFGDQEWCGLWVLITFCHVRTQAAPPTSIVLYVSLCFVIARCIPNIPWLMIEHIMTIW